MKRVHYLLLGLGLSVCIAAVAPSISGDGSRLTNVTAVQVVMTNGASIVPGGGGRLTVKDTNGNAMINIAPYSYTEIKYTDATSGDSLGLRINTNGFNMTGTAGATTYSGGFSNNQWYGDGSRLSKTPFIPLASSSPVYLASIPVVTTPTNNGDYSKCTSVCTLTIPPLQGSNSAIQITMTRICTNANTSAASFAFYIGTNTNFVATSSALLTTSVAVGTLFDFRAPLIVNCGSMTSQIAFSSGGTFYGYRSNLFNSAITNTLYIAAYTPSGSTHTNEDLVGISAVEIYRP